MLGKHTALYFIGRVVPGIASLVTLAAFTRMLTPAEYGSYALVISVVGVLNAVLFQWLGLSVNRFHSAYEHDAGLVISTAGVGFGLIVVATGIAGAIWAFVQPAFGVHLIAFAILVAWAQAWFDLNLRLASARLNPVAYGVASSIKSICALVLGAILFFLGAGLGGILSGLALALMGSTLLFTRYWCIFRLSDFDPAILKKFIAYGFPLALTFLLILVTDLSDRLFLSWYHGAAAVGSYAPSYDIAQQTTGTLMTVVNLACFPLVVAALEKSGLAAAQQQLQMNSRLLLAIAIPATCGLAALAEDVADLLMGPEFRATGAIVIPIIAAATFFSGIRAGYFDLAFQLGKRTHYQIWVVGIAATANLILNVALIPTWGVYGAAWSTLVAVLLALIASIYLGKTAFALPRVHRETLWVVIGAVLMTAVLFSLHQWHGTIALFTKVSAGFGIYLAVCLVVNVCGLRSSIAGFVLGRRV
jgi:O-antigen/teichoic acid export membrane protein